MKPSASRDSLLHQPQPRCFHPLRKIYISVYLVAVIKMNLCLYNYWG